tara:strand:- start:449 stop:2035 length:1587 start_codon:yes stop_codon:yes gene_type:complete
MSFNEELSVYFQSGYPLLYVQSLEAERAVTSIRKVCTDFNGSGLVCRVWKNTIGWEGNTSSYPDEWNPLGGSKDLNKVASFIDSQDAGVFVLVNFHRYLGENANAVVVQEFMDGYYTWKSQGKHVIIVSPTFEVTKELERLIQPVIYSLPTKEQLTDSLEVFIRLNFSDNEKFVGPSEDETVAIVNAGSGLTEEEFENAVVLSIVKGGEGRITPSLIMEEKAKILSKSEWIQYYPFPEDLSVVGGLGNFKDWANKRKKALTAKAREFGLPYPKGVLLLGVPGTGKSLTAKCLSKDWNIPLIRLDLGAVFGSLVGQSEANMRMGLEQVEALAPAVLWIDEMEKGLAGSSGSSNTDSGVTQRVFGTLLNWMQERNKDELIYVIATVNRIESLPPELLRKGRFDEIFWVDLPSKTEREEILKIHLSKRNQDTALGKKGWSSVLSASTNFSGAELESAVEDAMFSAFYEDRDAVNSDDLTKSLSSTFPLAQTMSTDIQRNRDWAFTNCRMAQESEPEEVVEVSSQSKRKVVI